MRIDNNFNFFKEYKEGFKSNQSVRYKKGDPYLIDMNTNQAENLIQNITKSLSNSIGDCSSLYYITTLNNLKSIYLRGIKSRKWVNVNTEKYGIYDFSNPTVQKRRSELDRITLNKVSDANIAGGFIRGKTVNVHECVNLYFTPINPMLYVVNNQAINNEVVVLSLTIDLLRESERQYIFSNKNIADSNVEMISNINDLNKIEWDVITGEYWKNEFRGKDYEEWKESRMAEMLVYPDIGSLFIENVLCSSYESVKKIRKIFSELISQYPEYYSKKIYDDICLTEQINNTYFS